MRRFSVLWVLLVTILSASADSWWEYGNFYQIYPRSFKDSDGDGIGDLKGITEKLQYIKNLGISGTWLSPIFKSPMADFGYDISDYMTIQPEYGTSEDFDGLIRKAKELGVKIILDFVPNHTSDEHEWFLKSARKESGYENYYIWHPGKLVDGVRQPPNNWVSVFRGSAWDWNSVREEYYLHNFVPGQPDLNYREPAVVEAMKDILRYWLSRGVDGFRIDAVPYLFEKLGTDGEWPDEPLTGDSCPNPEDYCYTQHIYTQDQPETFDMVFQWRKVLDDYVIQNGGEERILMTEAYTALDNIMKFYGSETVNGAQIPFNFELISNTNKDSTAQDFKNAIQTWQDKLPAGRQSNWVMGNHDNKRIASRFGVERADLFNILLQTLPGVAVTYNGEELAMIDVYLTWEQTKDPAACRTNSTVFDQYSRDPVRTPFQWDSSSNAGFSTGSSTWLPVSPDYLTNNVVLQESAENSHLKIFRHLVQLRHQENSLRYGDLTMKLANDNVLAYKRESSGSRPYLIVLNFGNQDVNVNLKNLFPEITAQSFSVQVASLASEYETGHLVGGTAFTAKAYQGYVLQSSAILGKSLSLVALLVAVFSVIKNFFI